MPKFRKDYTTGSYRLMFHYHPANSKGLYEYSHKSAAIYVYLYHRIVSLCKL